MADVTGSVIYRMREDIRELTGEPSVHAKYSNARLLTWTERAYAHVLGEINRKSATQLVVEHDITLDEDHKIYQLPPIVQRVLDLELLDSDGNLQTHIQPRSRYNPRGFGVVFEGNTIRWSSAPLDARILRVVFVPSGCVKLHVGEIAADADIVNDTGDDNDCVIDLATTPNHGEKDNRPNAYAGSIFRVLSAGTNNYVQERVIQSHDVTGDEGDGTVTLAPAFEATLLPGVTAGNVFYEIAPPFYNILDYVLATFVAMHLLVVEGDPRAAGVKDLYRIAVRDTMAQIKHYNALREGAQRDSRFRKGWVSGALSNPHSLTTRGILP